MTDDLGLRIDSMAAIVELLRLRVVALERRIATLESSTTSS